MRACQQQCYGAVAMKFQVLLRPLAAASVIALGLASCTRAQAPIHMDYAPSGSARSQPAASTPSPLQTAVPLATNAGTAPPSASTAAPRKVHFGRISGAAPSVWTDPRVVAELAKDCRFAPDINVHTDDMGELRANAFTCSFAYSQTCEPDACAGPPMHCQERCSATCTDCRDTCATSCESCKAGCTDDACRTKCASSCASCKQNCVRTLDRCDTGECNKAHADCRAKLVAAFRNPVCKVTCSAVGDCNSKCSAAAAPATCYEACDLKFDPVHAACAKRCIDGPASASAAESVACEEACPSNPCASPACELGPGRPRGQ
jgi:hypothetical protein